jgi:hypothetical protein
VTTIEESAMGKKQKTEQAAAQEVVAKYDDDQPASQEQIDYFRALADLVAQRRMPTTKRHLSAAIRGLRAQQRALGEKDRSPDDWFAYHVNALAEIEAARELLGQDVE